MERSNIYPRHLFTSKKRYTPIGKPAPDSDINTIYALITSLDGRLTQKTNENESLLSTIRTLEERLQLQTDINAKLRAELNDVQKAAAELYDVLK